MRPSSRRPGRRGPSRPEGSAAPVGPARGRAGRNRKKRWVMSVKRLSLAVAASASLALSGCGGGSTGSTGAGLSGAGQTTQVRTTPGATTPGATTPGSAAQGPATPLAEALADAVTGAEVAAAIGQAVAAVPASGKRQPVLERRRKRHDDDGPGERHRAARRRRPALRPAQRHGTRHAMVDRVGRRRAGNDRYDRQYGLERCGAAQARCRRHALRRRLHGHRARPRRWRPTEPTCSGSR